LFGRAMEAAAQTVLKEKGTPPSAQSGSRPRPLTIRPLFLLLPTPPPTSSSTVGNDFVTSIKQAHEYGLARSGKKLAGLITYLSDVQSLGLDLAQGFTSIGTRTTLRTFAARFEKVEGRKPIIAGLVFRLSVLISLNKCLTCCTGVAPA